MNCANHPDRERAAFCQNCGKPLCTECVRNVGTSVFCEPCLAARVRTWHLAVDETETRAEDRQRTDSCTPGSAGRFVRVTFTGLPPNTPARISEVRIDGHVRTGSPQEGDRHR